VELINKLRKKPEKERKIILWSILIIIGLVLSIIWIYNSFKAINELKENNIMQSLDISSMEQNIPNLEIPNDFEENLSEEEIEEILKNTTQ
jgi:cytoskeletal protein RodZ